MAGLDRFLTEHQATASFVLAVAVAVLTFSLTKITRRYASSTDEISRSTATLAQQTAAMAEATQKTARETERMAAAAAEQIALQVRPRLVISKFVVQTRPLARDQGSCDVSIGWTNVGVGSAIAASFVLHFTDPVGPRIKISPDVMRAVTGTDLIKPGDEVLAEFRIQDAELGKRIDAHRERVLLGAVYLDSFGQKHAVTQAPNGEPEFVKPATS